MGWQPDRDPPWASGSHSARIRSLRTACLSRASSLSARCRSGTPHGSFVAGEILWLGLLVAPRVPGYAIGVMAVYSTLERASGF